MKPRENESTTHRDLPARCRYPECVATRAEELAALGAIHLAAEIQKSDLPVRCRRVSK